MPFVRFVTRQVMERFICVSLYNLLYDALSEEDIDAVFDEGIVVGVSSRCASLGVRVGDSTSLALTLSPAMKVANRSLTKEFELFRDVTSLVRRFSPFFVTTNSREIFLPVKSVIRYYGIEEKVVESLSKVLLNSGLVRTSKTVPLQMASGTVKAYFSIGAAPGRFYAYLASRYDLVVENKDVRDFVYHLPIRDVAPAQLCSELEDLGIKGAAEFLAIGHNHLSKRYGSYGSLLYELLSGEKDWAYKLLDTEISWETSVEFDYHTTSEAIIFAVLGPVSELLDTLEQSTVVPSVVSVCVLTTEGEFSKDISAPHGLSNKVLMERINFYLESLKGTIGNNVETSSDLYDKGVREIKVRVKEVTPITSIQSSLDNVTINTEEDVRKTLDRVVSLAGDNSVLSPRSFGGRSLSDAAHLVPFAEKTLTKSKRLKSLGDSAPWPGSLVGRYPTCVYEKPFEVTVLDSSGKLVSMNGRGVLATDPYEVVMPSSVRLTVSNFIGPWIVEEKWWTDKNQRYGRILVNFSEDATVHLLCRKKQRWFLEATYD